MLHMSLCLTGVEMGGVGGWVNRVGVRDGEGRKWGLKG